MAQMLYQPDPGTRYVWVGQGEKWPVGSNAQGRAFFRGDSPPDETKKVDFLLYKEKNRTTPDVFLLEGFGYIACNHRGREFLQKHAGVDCEFISINTYHGAGEWKPWDGKKKERTEDQFYCVYIRNRLDSVDWERSLAKPYNGPVYEMTAPDQNVAVPGAGAVDWPPSHVENGKLRGGKHSTLCLRKSIIKDHHIWREHLNGWEQAWHIFISDSLMQKMRKEVKACFSYIYMPEC